MKVLIDMNLSPTWVKALEGVGHDARHWSTVGSPGAPDKEILDWARNKGYVLFTHDLDFGAILAATRAGSPSVIQIRTQNPTPALWAKRIGAILNRYNDELAAGALISVDADRARLRVLPLQQNG